MTDWEKELEIEMINGEMNQTIAAEIGVQNFLKLVKIAGGRALYLPVYDNVIRPLRDRQIKKEYNGYNEQEIARKYGITERRVMQICGGSLMNGQCSMFEES